MKPNPDEPTSLMPGSVATQAAVQSADAVIAEYLEAREAGRNPDPHEFLARYPEFSQELRAFLDSFVDFECFVRELGGNCLAPGIRSSSADTPGVTTPGVNDRTQPMSRTGKPTIESIPKAIGDCEILEEIGRGGMGVVYRARHTELNRIVALKTIPSYAFADDTSRSRFRAEARAAAALEHPGIVPIYHVGEHEGVPYFTMAYVAGPSLSRKLHEGPLDPRQAAEIIRQAAVAMGWAHSRGFVHRDIKPGNILLDARDRPMLVDFGLARHVTDESNLTTTGQIIGTPNYIAPEQARGDRVHGCPSADIYSLGAVLYCVLTGRPPFQSPSVAETLAAVQSREPVPLRRLDPAIPQDLETITLKCLEKASDRRYATSEALADDLQRFLNGDTIVARPTMPWVRAWRWCRRNRLVAALSGLIAAMLVLATVILSFAAARFESLSDVATKNASKARKAEDLAIRKADDAVAARQESRYELARSSVERARMTRLSHRVGQRVEALKAVRHARTLFTELRDSGFPIKDEDWQSLRNEAASAMLLADIETTDEIPEPQLEITSTTCDFAHQRFAQYSSSSGLLRIRSLVDGSLLGSLKSVNGAQGRYAEFTEDGRRVLFSTDEDNAFEIWDVESANPRLMWSHPAVRVVALAEHSPLVGITGNDGRSRILDLETGNPVGPEFVAQILEGRAFSPNGKLVATGWDNETRLIDLASGEVRTRWEPRAHVADWSIDSTRVVATRGEIVESRLVASGAVLFQLSGLRGGAKAIVARDADLIAGADWFHTAILWDLNSGAQVLTFPTRSSIANFGFIGSTGRQRRLDFGNHHLSATSVRCGRLKELAPGSIARAVISPGSRRLAVALNHSIGLFDLTSGVLLDERESPGHEATPLVFEKNGRSLLISVGRGSSGGVLRWPIEIAERDGKEPAVQFGTSTPVVEFNPGAPGFSTDDGSAFAFPYGDSMRIAVATPTSPEHWERKSIPISQHDVRNAAISPDHQWVVAGSHVSGHVVLHRLSDGQRMQTLADSGGWAEFSPDGRWCAVSHFAGTAKVFRTDDWSVAYELPGTAIVFTPDSRILAVDDGGGAVLMADVQTGQTLVRLETADPGGVSPQAISDDGEKLICIARVPPRLLSFDLKGLREDLRQLDLDWSETTAAAPK